jgi:hypothetical protein
VVDLLEWSGTLRNVDPGWPEMDAARCERKEPERFLRLSSVEQEGGERRAGLDGDDQSKEVSLRFGSVCGPVDGGWGKISRGDNSRRVVPEGRSMSGGRESRRKGNLPLWPEDLVKDMERLASRDVKGSLGSEVPGLDGIAESLRSPR